MSQKIVVASFAREEDLLAAARALRKLDWKILDVYSPYAVHGLDEALDWPRSRLPAACFLGGATGVVLATWFQFWTTASDWPLNVGGRPWNSFPAFFPVIFETMVLFAGFTLVFAWLIRCGLYPGKRAELPRSGVTDDCFVVMFHDPGSAAAADAAQQLLHECHALGSEERDAEGQQ
jgi:hypothetical protein